MGQMWEMLGEGLVHHAVLWASVTTVLRDQGELATSGPAHTWEGNAIEQQFHRYLEIRLKEDKGQVPVSSTGAISMSFPKSAAQMDVTPTFSLSHMYIRLALYRL